MGGKNFDFGQNKCKNIELLFPYDHFEGLKWKNGQKAREIEHFYFFENQPSILQYKVKKSDIIGLSYSKMIKGSNKNIKRYSKKEITEMSNKNNYVFTLSNVGAKYIFLWVNIEADEKKYPDVLDLLLEKKIKL